jgi:hypothetical protein
MPRVLVAFAAVAVCACHGSSSQQRAPEVSDRCERDEDCTLDWGHSCCGGCGSSEPLGAITVARDTALTAQNERECAAKRKDCPVLNCASPPACIPQYRAVCKANACATEPTKTCPPPGPAWQSVRLENLDNAVLRSAITVTPDGRVVFSGDGVVEAPTVADLPPDVRATIDAWATTGLSPETPHPGEKWTTRIHLVTSHEAVAEYASNAMPAPEQAVAGAVGGLINTPRTAAPCPVWDGTGDFAVDVERQDFGVAPGPLQRVTVSTKTLATDQADKLRAAVVAADLGHFTTVYGGGGEGSNLRLIQLTTPAGRCGRAFTNTFPKELDPVLLLVK